MKIVADIIDEDFYEEEFGIIDVVEPEKIEDLWRNEIKKRIEARRRQREIPSLIWIAKELNIDPEILTKTLKSVRNGTAYKVFYRPKPNGGTRKVCAPNKDLMTVQRRINEHILRFLRPSQNVFGFCGGSVIDAIKPHIRKKGTKTILCVDFKDAFPTIVFDNVFYYLTDGRSKWDVGFYRIMQEYGGGYGWFSWYAARILAELTTYEGKLPQGAPTSPRLFDLLCEKIDKGLLKLAKNVGGVYTRYADNIFFSIWKKEFPRPLKQAILKLIEGREWSPTKKHLRREGPNFDWHKLKIKRIGRPAIRMLGLNVIDNKIHNTRDFKRKLRLSIHHVNWFINNGRQNTPEFETAQQKLQGQMAFARVDTLPPKLLDDYAALQKKLAA